MAIAELPTEPDLQDALQKGVLRAVFGAMALVCLLGSAALLVGDLPEQVRWLAALGCLAVALLALAASRRQPAHALHLMWPVVLGGMGVLGAVAWFSGWGLQTPGLVFLGLAVCVSHAVGPTGLGTVSALLALGLALGLAAAEQAGWLPTPGAAAPLVSRLLMHGAAIVAGALLGQRAAQLTRQHLASADAREQRFRALLGVAATAYWETDATLRLTQASRRNQRGHFVPMADVLGRLPWSVPALRFDDDNIDLMRAEMEARATLRDLAFWWQSSDGRVRHYRCSGEPRFDDAGRFLGYWGVVRDVTAEQQARAALAATETRYHELFKRIPTPLTLHQRGAIVDANPAAALLLGYASVPEMLGLDLVGEHGIESERGAVRARLAQVEAIAAGQALPPAEMTLRSRQGRVLYVKSLATRTDHQGAAAVLSIMLDETERRAAALALQRSQTLLARVVSMSPDIIALSEQPSGRYVMVNESYTRLLGYAASEVVGRSALELGLWRNPADRARLRQAIEQQGSAQDVLVEMLSRTGRVVPLMMSATHLEADGRSYELTNARDMSETTRVRLEREAILANASVGIAFTRTQRFIVANAQFEKMFGWPAGTLVGQPLPVLWASEAEYDALRADIGPTLSRGEPVDVERQALRRDGSGFVLRLRAKAIDPTRPADSGTIWIAEDVTAARQAEQELARARDAAEAANRAKSAFLANTSHEIRTPLNGLLGLARLARQPALPPARLRQYLDQIGESAEVLAMIMSDILDVAKIEAGKLQLETAPFDLRELLHSLQQAYAALSASHGLAFEVRLDPGLPAQVRGDALRVRQILANFLHNALKFTASGGIRLVALTLPGERVRFEVHDTGPGIDEATQARLFVPFTQADESTTRRYGGTGLGLSICRELAQLMGGTVGLSSRAGVGSCFHAELPLPAVPVPEAVATPAPEDDPQLRGMRVLMVEDNSINMMVGVALLEQWGLQVVQAVDGSQALAAVAQAAAEGMLFDAVLMDVQMPGMSGYEATQVLRQTYSAAQLPVIALTAAALVSERERAERMGMNDFLTKPIDPLRLHAALRRALLARATA